MIATLALAAFAGMAGSWLAYEWPLAFWIVAGVLLLGVAL